MQEKLKAIITELSHNQQFIHNQWFIDYHLQLVEDICKELLNIYSGCNADIVFALVRIHDYTKIGGYDEMSGFEKGYDLLLQCGYEEHIAKTVIQYRKLFEQKMSIDLHTSPLEVQIVSSADAMSHYVGPFFSLYRHEHPEKSLHQLYDDNRKKLKKDLERKAVLPEAYIFIEKRLPLFYERYCGQIPTTFLS